MQAVIRQAPLNLSERRPSPEQILAGAVLALAVSDAHDANQSERCRASATAFLLEAGEMLTFWASVAGLDRELVREQARRSLTRRRVTMQRIRTLRRHDRTDHRHVTIREPQHEPAAAASF
jgi:hypothetical protein